MIDCTSSEESLSLPSSLDIKVDQFKDDFSCEDIIDISLKNLSQEQNYDNKTTINLIDTRQRCETIEEKDSQFEKSFKKESLTLYKNSEESSLIIDQLNTLRKNSFGSNQKDLRKLKITKRKNTFKEELDKEQNIQNKLPIFNLSSFKKKKSLQQIQNKRILKKQKKNSLLPNFIYQQVEHKSLLVLKQNNFFSMLLKQQKMQPKKSENKQTKILKQNIYNKNVKDVKKKQKKLKFQKPIYQFNFQRQQFQQILLPKKVPQNSLKQKTKKKKVQTKNQNKKFATQNIQSNNIEQSNEKKNPKNKIQQSFKLNMKKKISGIILSQKLRSSLNKTFDRKLFDINTSQRFSTNSYAFEKNKNFKSFIQIINFTYILKEI